MLPAVGPLGEFIRAYRVRERWSLRAISRRSGISLAQLHAMERGRAPNMHIKTVMALAKACETTVARIATLSAESICMEDEA